MCVFFLDSCLAWAFGCLIGTVNWGFATTGLADLITEGLFVGFCPPLLLFAKLFLLFPPPPLPADAYYDIYIYFN